MPKLWTKNFVFATFSGLFSSMVFYVTMTTLVGYAQGAFGASEGMSGLVVGIFVIGGAAGRLFGGRYIEEIGRRKLLLVSGAAFALVSAMYMLPLNLSALMIIRLLHGAAFGAFHNALSTVVVAFIPVPRRGEGIGYFSLNFVIATALGPFIGLYFAQHVGYGALFALNAGFALAAFVLALFVRTQAAVQRGAAKKGGLFEPKALPLACVIIFMSICYTGVTAFLDSYAAEQGAAAIAPWFFIIYGAAILVARPLAGKLLDKRGGNIVMLPSIAFFAVSLLVLSFADGAWLFALSAVLMALGYGNILNMGQALAVGASPPERVGTATSTYFVFSDTGMGAGPLIMGLVVSLRGFSGMYVVAAIVAALGLGLYWVLWGRNISATTRR
ncbi:MFS transporter [Clostridia bacterium]|nr:MFS transporter [Clostridia bacterium]